MQEKEEIRKKSEEKSALGKRTSENQEKNTPNKTREKKKARLIECLSNLNALHKVQGAILTQMEQNID